MESHPYTCISCQLAFSSSGAQREHYASDFHRYNAKRKVAALPPVSEDVFNAKVVDSRAEAVEGEKAAAEKLSCKACQYVCPTLDARRCTALNMHLLGG